MSRRLPLLALVGLALAVYANTLGHGFAYDDYWLLVDNPSVRSLNNAGHFFTTGYQDRIYRPLTLLSFALDYALVGLEPLLYHAENLALNAVVTILVCLLLRPVAGQTAWLAAALFAVHPVHTEVVANVTSRSELLATLLGLLALWQIHRPALAACSLLLALLAKESAVAVPALALLLWWRLPEQPPLRRKAVMLGALAAAVAAYLLLHYRARGGILLPKYVLFEVDNPLFLADWPTRVRTGLMIVGQNLALCFVPYHLSADYSFPQIPPVTAWTEPRFLLWTALPAAAVAAALAVWRTHPNFLRGLAWFLLALAPVSNLVAPIGTIRAERMLYLPSVGTCLVAAEALGLLMAVRRRWAIALAALLLATLGMAAARRNLVWRNQETLVTATVADAPRSARAHYLLAEYRAGAGNCVAALPSFRRALELSSDVWMAKFKMADCLERMGDLGAAEQHYRELFISDPTDERFARMLARLCARRNDWSCVAATLRQWMAANKEAARAPDVWITLANALLRNGQLEEAEAAYRQAISRGDQPVAHFNLAGLLVRRKRFDQAIAEYRAAERLGLNTEELYVDLATAQKLAGDAAAVRETAARGRERSPASEALKKLAR